MVDGDVWVGVKWLAGWVVVVVVCGWVAGWWYWVCDYLW